VGVRWWYLDAIYLSCAIVAVIALLVIPSLFHAIGNRRHDAKATESQAAELTE